MKTSHPLPRPRTTFGYGRFVLSIGAMADALAHESKKFKRHFLHWETYEAAPVFLWDVQEDRPVLVLTPHYRNSLCLGLPLEDLEDFLNRASNRALKSEGIPPTRPGVVRRKIAQLEKYLS